MPGIAITSDSIDNPNELGTAIEEALKETEMETNDINIHTGTYHENWDSNEPCPYCGGEHFIVPVANNERYVQNDEGHLIFEETTDDVGPMLGYFCDDCDELIAQVPYSKLL